MKKQPTNQAQDGNVLFIVLIAISLLVALTISLTSSERFSNSMDNERITFELQEIYQYAQSIERAISHMLLNNGCEILQLNFDHPDLINYNTTDYYLNSNAPLDKSCDLFAPEGGGVLYSAPPSMSQAQGVTEYGILSAYNIAQLGTASSDLFLHTRLPEEACLKVNNEQDIANVSGTPPLRGSSIQYPYTVIDTFPSFLATDSEGFRNIGEFGTALSSHEVLANRKIGCFRSGATQNYEFYYTLIVR